MISDKTYYAFYSKLQETNNKNIDYFDNRKPVRYNIYKLVNGEEVKATEVNKSKNFSNGYSDLIRLGKIESWISTIFWE